MQLTKESAGIKACLEPDSVQAPKLPSPSEYGRASRTAVQQSASHFRSVAQVC